MSHPVKVSKGNSKKIVCECLDVTEVDLLEAIRTHKLESVKDIAHYTQAGKGCTACHDLLRQYLKNKRYLTEISPI